MLKVIQPGIYASIQDQGRFNFRSYGVPVSGAMDQYSARLANLIIGNNEQDAVLEVTNNGIFQFKKETTICISGADLHATLNNEQVPINQPVIVSTENILTFERPKIGFRAYVAIRGGFLNKPVLGSRSLFNQITKKHYLSADDEIFYEPFSMSSNMAFSHVKVDSNHFTDHVLDAYKGPEYERLNLNQKQLLEQTEFTISSEHNRMGYRLTETLENQLGEMLTSSMMPGTVQLTPSGTLIILMRDCGVTGGYPRILQLTERSINKIAQKNTKDQIKFNLVDL